MLANYTESVETFIFRYKYLHMYRSAVSYVIGVETNTSTYVAADFLIANCSNLNLRLGFA